MKKKIILFLILILTPVIFLIMNSGEEEQVDQTSGFDKIKIIFKSALDSKSPLEKTVKDALSETSGIYAVAIKNLKTGESYFLNEHRQFQTGSLYKLWVMATVFDQIQKGNIKEDEVLSEDVYKLNKKFHIPDDSAELKEGVVTLRVADALNQMITISHNYAALLLADKIKQSTINNFLKNNGFLESIAGNNLPTSSALDIELFLEKLYKNEFADKINTDKMLNLLKNQKLNNKLPKDLPDGTMIAHKTGELDNFTHDAGIVYLSDQEYIIVVLSESNSPFGAEDIISDISKNVFDYFSKK